MRKSVNMILRLPMIGTLVSLTRDKLITLTTITILFILSNFCNTLSAREEISDHPAKSNEKKIGAFIIPSPQKHTATVIFLHGFGDTGKKWSGFLWANQIPYMKIVCPNADEKYGIITDDNGKKNMTAWFNLNPNFTVYDNYNDVKAATKHVHNLIESEIKNGIPPERIILGGYYHGASLALQTAFTYPHKLAGVIALGTELPNSNYTQKLNSPNKNIPILHCNGNGKTVDEDNHGEVEDDVFKSIAANYFFDMYNGLDNEYQSVRLMDLRSFLEICSDNLDDDVRNGSTTVSVI